MGQLLGFHDPVEGIIDDATEICEAIVAILSAEGDHLNPLPSPPLSITSKGMVAVG